MLVLLSLLGCAEIKETFEGLTNPMVALGFMVGVEPPEDERIDLSGTRFEQGASALAMLADAAEADQMDEAPVTGASVAMMLDAHGRVDMPESGGGAYAADASDGLVYEEGDTATLSATYGDETSSIAMRLPPSPDIVLPDNTAAGSGMTVDLSGQGFDNVLVFVMDATTGEVTFENTPTGIEDLYDLAHGDSEVVVPIPPKAIARESVYAVGVAGLKNADAADVENANTALSAFVAGRVAFKAVSTLPQ